MMSNATAEALETKHANARRRVRQDKQDPLLICMEDGMLYPNVPNIRKKATFIVYRGDAKASLDERMAYVKSMKGGHTGRRGVVNTQEAFDIGKASKEELIDFALTEYDAELKPNDPLMVLRKQVQALAEKFDAMVQHSKVAGDDIS